MGTNQPKCGFAGFRLAHADGHEMQWHGGSLSSALRLRKMQGSVRPCEPMKRLLVDWSNTRNKLVISTNHPFCISFLVGGWFTPLKNMSQLGWWQQPNINGKIKNGNQTTNQFLYIFLYGWKIDTDKIETRKQIFISWWPALSDLYEGRPMYQ